MTLNAGRAALLLAVVALAFGAWRLTAPSTSGASDDPGGSVTRNASVAGDAPAVRVDATGTCAAPAASPPSLDVAGPGATPAVGRC